MSTPETKSAFIIDSFSDAGTGASYTAGDTVPIEAGAFGNYKAAGLVRAATAPKAVKNMDGKGSPAA